MSATTITYRGLSGVRVTLNVDTTDVVMSDGWSREGTCTPFTVTLSKPVAVATTLHYTVEVGGSENATAAAADVDTSDIAIPFRAGLQSASVCVTIPTDAIVENNETFVLKLKNVSSLVAGNPALFNTAAANGVGYIFEEVQVSIADAQVSEGGALKFLGILDHAVSSAVWVNYTVSLNGTAT